MKTIIQSTIDRLIELSKRPDCPSDLCHEIAMITLDLNRALNAEAEETLAKASLNDCED